MKVRIIFPDIKFPKIKISNKVKIVLLWIGVRMLIVMAYLITLVVVVIAAGLTGGIIESYGVKLPGYISFSIGIIYGILGAWACMWFSFDVAPLLRNWAYWKYRKAPEYSRGSSGVLNIDCFRAATRKFD